MIVKEKDDDSKVIVKENDNGKIIVKEEDTNLITELILLFMTELLGSFINDLVRLMAM